MHAITVLSMLRILSQMSFYQANDFAEATFAENMKLKVQVISSNNQGSARVKFTTDDKVMVEKSMIEESNYSYMLFCC